MNVSTELQRDLLYVIAGHENADEETLRTVLEEYYGTTIDRKRLSTNVGTLHERGFIERAERDRQMGRYVLTGRGHRELETRRDWEARHIDLR